MEKKSFPQGGWVVFVKDKDRSEPINFQLHLIIFGQDIVRKLMSIVSKTWLGLCSLTLSQRGSQLGG